MARATLISSQFTIAMQQTVEATKLELVKTAKREHAKVMGTDPRPGRFSRFVDGREGAPEESVKTYGIIEYNYQRVEMIIQFAMDTLFDKSPVLTGDYRISHTIFLNGVAVANLKDWKEGDEIVILNPVPYARKIEQGRMQMRVPGTDRVYQQAQRIVSRRYGNQMNIKFSYRSPIHAYVPLGGKRGGKAASAEKRAAHESEAVTRAPALIFTGYR